MTYLLTFCLSIYSTMRVHRWMKPLFIFNSCPKRICINYVSQPLKNGMNIRENTTYMKVLIFKTTINRLYFRKMHMMQLSRVEQEAPVLRGELPLSRFFLKSPVLRWSRLERQIFMKFLSRITFLQTRCESLGYQ